MAMKIKKGDPVIVIAGKEKGREGKVLHVNTKDNTVIVEGLNKVKKHEKASQKNPNGGIIEVEAPIHASNVMIAQNGKGVRVGFEVRDGKKVRINKKTGDVIA
ncbi:MAG: 50S ribosomal protein L24 [Lachnospiraceae bacterium]|jgi:large subunit ribosomal protein L24|nr:50S ribosomal protein L24 [Lachnospiraceae bacterium]MBQ7601530.1 50S ribosomal protein L24 [Lachnospiraceae bacterium]MBR5339652.1 50S ribosomal protein L24 [Lachnospiraceae bacterium]